LQLIGRFATKPHRFALAREQVLLHGIDGCDAIGRGKTVGCIKNAVDFSQHLLLPPGEAGWIQACDWGGSRATQGCLLGLKALRLALKPAFLKNFSTPESMQIIDQAHTLRGRRIRPVDRLNGLAERGIDGVEIGLYALRGRKGL
jgi:hypothetical protein